ncbi:transcriptional regulator [Natronomonas sp. LN261]|uniref:transcriptional regulator n=1 Tax=Natronomonas sp. LN261 TaxID=2750669 RepID=UPI0015EF14E0|nr:transcriptional regulator [Natronomonas sp. LN261]
MPKDRDDEGKYSQSYSDSDFVNAVKNLDVASTQLVSEKVGCSYDLAYRRLGDLYEEGILKRVEVGGSFVYYTD